MHPNHITFERYFVPVWANGIPLHDNKWCVCILCCVTNAIPFKIEMQSKKIGTNLSRVRWSMRAWLDQAFISPTKNRKQISQYFISIMNADFFSFHFINGLVQIRRRKGKKEIVVLRDVWWLVWFNDNELMMMMVIMMVKKKNVDGNQKKNKKCLKA